MLKAQGPGIQTGGERFYLRARCCIQVNYLEQDEPLLGKKTKKVVVFDSDFKEIANSDNRPIGKKVFSLHLKDKEYSQFFVENTDYYSQEEKIIPVTSQWDLDLD